MLSSFYNWLFFDSIHKKLDAINTKLDILVGSELQVEINKMKASGDRLKKAIDDAKEDPKPNQVILD